MASIQGVRDQLSWQGQFEEIRVLINSHGGDIAEGLGIYDLLRSYNVPIVTFIIGQCCSAATIIFLAGKTRLISENVVAFMVHQAKGGGEGTADDLRTIADFIDSYNERMAAIYMEATGKDAETVAGWLSTDTFMTAEQALANGFATAIQKPIEAKHYASKPITAGAPPAAPIQPPVVAESTPSSNQFQSTAMKILKDKFDRVVASAKALLEGKTIVAKDVTTDTGEMLTIETADGGDNYAEGDSVKKGADPAPDGTYKIGNVTMVVKDGKIELLTSTESADVTASAGGDKTTTEENAAVTASAEEVLNLRTENEQLKGQVATMQSTLGTVQAKMDLLLGMRESADVKIPASASRQIKSVTAQGTTSDEEDERQKMLDERKNRGLRKPDTADK